MMEAARILGYIALLAFGVFFFEISHFLKDLFFESVDYAYLEERRSLTLVLGLVYGVSLIFFLVRGFSRLEEKQILKLVFLIVIATCSGLLLLRLMLGQFIGGILS